MPWVTLGCTGSEHDPAPAMILPGPVFHGPGGPKRSDSRIKSVVFWRPAGSFPEAILGICRGFGRGAIPGDRGDGMVAGNRVMGLGR